MGFLNTLNNKLEASLQNAKTVKEEKIKTEIIDLLIENENIEYILSHYEDYTVFTNLRLLIVDKSPISSKKVVISINYNKISSFGIRKGGHFHLHKKLKSPLEVIIMNSKQ